MINIIKNIGKTIWIALGIFLAVIVFSWSKYAFSGNGLGSIIILIFLPVFIISLLVYLIITAVYLIKGGKKKK